MWAAAPYKTIHDVRNTAPPRKCGGTGNTGYYVPKLLEETIAAKFTVVTEDPGGADIELAVERGEMQCRAISIPVYFGREPYDTWRQKGLVRILVQTGTQRESRLADVPTLYEIMDQYQTSAPIGVSLRSCSATPGSGFMADGGYTEHTAGSTQNTPHRLREISQRS